MFDSMTGITCRVSSISAPTMASGSVAVLMMLESCCVATSSSMELRMARLFVVYCRFSFFSRSRVFSSALM